MSDSPLSDEPEPIIVHLVRRTLPEQVEWLILQVSFLVAKVNRLEHDSEALILAVKSLEGRMTAVERAVPWKAPKASPPVDPFQPRPGRRSSFTHSYDEAMEQLEAEVEKIRRRDDEEST